MEKLAWDFFIFLGIQVLTAKPVVLQIHDYMPLLNVPPSCFGC
jgi:hypothetical protein